MTSSLITRRSQVQILPPPPRESPGQSAWGFVVSGVVSTGAVYRLALQQGCDLGIRKGEPVDVYRPSVEVSSSGRLSGWSRWVVRRAANRLAALGSHAGQDVLVGGHGEAGVGVTEAFGDDLDRDAGADEEGGVGVSQVMEPNTRHVESGGVAGEELAD